MGEELGSLVIFETLNYFKFLVPLSLLLGSKPMRLGVGVKWRGWWLGKGIFW